MSRTIDEKVVEMKFDNSNFESNVRTSMSTLDKLKSSIKNSESAVAFKDIDKAVKNVKFDGLNNGIEEVKARFSALDMAANAVISRITNSIINLSTKFLSAIPQQIIQGGINRAMNIENARFQLQGLIDDEKEVNKIMDQAGDSVSGTAYSYDAAAKAASMFAASGLKSGYQMETALKAIAGTAATVNADYESISNIFTTIAGNGRIMGEQLNQFSYRGMNAAAALTKYFNAVNDGSIEATESVKKSIKEITSGKQIVEADLRELVSDGKVSFEIFSEAMGTTFGDHAKDANKTFTGSLKNIKAALARTGEAFVAPLIKQEGPVVHLFNTIREKINEMNGVIKPFARWSTYAFNNFITQVDNVISNMPIKDITHAVTDAASGIFNILRGISTFLKPIAESFKEVFKIDSSSILQLAHRFKVATSSLKASDSTVKNLKDGFKGIFDVIKLVAEGFVKLLRAIFPTIGPIKSVSDGIVGIFGAIGRGLTAFTEWVRGSERLKRLYEGLSNVIRTVSNGIKGFLDGVRESVHIDTSGIENLGNKFRSISINLEPLKNFMSKVGEKLGPVFAKIGEGLKTLGSGLLDILKKIDPIKAFFALLNGTFITGAVASIKKLIDNMRDMVSAPGVIVTKIKFIMTNLSNYLKALTIAVNAGALKDIAKAILMLAGACLILSTIDAGKLAVSLGALAAMLGELMGTFFIFQKIGLLGIKSSISFTIIAEALTNLGMALIMLSIAMKILSTLDNDQIASGLIAIGVLLAELITTMAVLKALKIDKGITKIAFSFIILGLAMQTLAKAVASLGSLDSDVLIKGLLSVGAILVGLSIFTKIVGGSKKMFSIGAGILLVSLAIKNLYDSTAKFGELNTSVLVKGLIALGAVLLELGIFTRIAGGKRLISTSIALLILTQSIKQLIIPFQSLGNMKWEQIIKSSVAMGIIFTLIGVALRLMPSKKALTKVLAFTIIALALTKLTTVLKELSIMTWDQIGRSLTMMGGALMALVFTIEILSLSKRIKISNIIALLVIVNSLKMLVEPLTSFGRMSWDNIGRSLAAMGGVLLELVLFISILSTIKRVKITNLIGILVITSIIQNLVPYLISLGNMSWDNIGRSLVAMGGALAELVIVMAIISKVGGGFKAITAALSMLILAQVVSSLATALVYLSSMNWDDIGRSLTAMGIAIAILISAMAVFGALGSVILIGSGVLLVAAISLALSISILSSSIENIVDVVKKCSDIDADTFTKTCETLAKGIFTLGLSLMSFGPFSIIGAYSLKVLSESLGILLPTLKSFMALKPEKLSDTFKRIGEGISVFGKSLKSFGLFSGIGASSLYIVAEALQTLMIPLVIFSKMNPNKLSSSFETLGQGISEFGKSLKSFGLFSGIGATSLLIMSSAISIMAPSLAILSSLDGKKLGNTMTTIGDGFKSFADAIDELGLFSPAGAAAITILCDGVKKLATSLPALTKLGSNDISIVMNTIGNAFKKFGEALEATPFWGARTRAKGIGALIDNIDKLTESLPGFMALDSDGVKNAMNILSAGFKSFGEAIAETPFWGAKSRAEGIGKLCEEIGTLTSTLPGFMELDADKAKESFVVLGEGFSEFGKALQSAPLFSADKGEGVANLVNSISNLTKGLEDFISAKFDPNEVESAFETIGQGFFTFGESLQSTPFFNVKERGEALVTIVGSITKLANGVEYFTNHTDEKAGETLTSIGNSMKDFASALKGTPWFKAEEKGESLRNVISMIKDLGDSMGYFKETAGTSSSMASTLESIGVSLGNFGKALQSTPFFESESRAQSLVTVIQNLGTLGDVLVGLEKHDGNKLQNRFDVLSNGITNLGTSLKNWNGIGFEGSVGYFKSFIDSLNSLFTVGTGEGTGIDITSILTNLQGIFTYDAGTQTLTEFIRGIKEHINTEFGLEEGTSTYTYESAYALIQGIKTGLEENKEDFLTFIDEMWLTPIKDKIDEFIGEEAAKDMGKCLVDGLKDGIEENSQTAIGAARKLGEECAAAFEAANKISSPSKVFYGFGRFLDMGLANGIRAYTNLPVDAVSRMGDTINSVAARVSAAVGDNMDMNPVIRPVLDTTNISNGIGIMNSMFGSAQARVSATATGYAESMRLKAAQLDISRNAQNKLNASYANALVEAVNSIGATDTNVNVVLAGDAAGVFKLVRTENSKFAKATGYNPLAQGRG